MISIQQIISDAEFQYKPQETRMTIPVDVRSSHSDTIRPSALGKCPLAHAYSKAKVEGIYKVKDGNRGLQHLFKMGEYAAMLIQESLMYYAMRSAEVSFLPEVEFYDETLGIAGRADGVIEVNRGFGVIERAVIEIKNTEGQQKRSIGPCSESYALQTIAYMIMGNFDKGYVVTTSKWKVVTYEIKRRKPLGSKSGDQTRDSFIVYDEDGEVYDKPWNNLESLSYAGVELSVGERKEYMTEVNNVVVSKDYSDDPDTIPWPYPPIQDPLNHPDGWQCFWMFDKGRHKRPPLRAAKCTMKCEYADKCHGVAYGDMIFAIKDSNGDWVMPDSLSGDYLNDN
jgi:hypothetical protein